MSIKFSSLKSSYNITTGPVKMSQIAVAAGVTPGSKITLTTAQTNVIPQIGLIFEAKFGSPTLPTQSVTKAGGTYSITRYGTNSTYNDTAKRGYVLNATGGTYLGTPCLITPSYSKVFWVFMTGGLPGNGNLLSTLTYPANTGLYYVWFNGTNQVHAGHHPAADITVGVKDPSNIVMNSWIHFVVTYDEPSKTMVLDRNGVNVNSKTDAILSWSGATGVGTTAIGTLVGSYTMTGYLDNVRIYNRALTASEVSAIYNFENTNPKF